ncbi:uncharacterized protein PAC_08594 [Phialocephala subalpina]|uniref:Fungal N-terminal domain-containing protein n=1 Tax=Phialocephala subalpina TaxID=576137 RepID=A0A1L7X110_9HELO|nr:uncharacterized protein PAC_08594 [Phialocephala subalpina]
MAFSIDPTSVFSNVASTIVSSLQLATFVKDVKNTPLDVKTCIALTTLISTDVQYLIKLRSSPSNITYLSQNPDLAARIDNIIISTHQAILDVCRLLEGCRQEVYEGGNVPLRERMRWVLGDSMAFKRREGNLQGVHRAVLSEVGFLRMRESAGETVSKVIECVSFENLELLEMNHRRRDKRATKAEVVEVKMDEEPEKQTEAERGQVLLIPDVVMTGAASPLVLDTSERPEIRQTPSVTSVRHENPHARFELEASSPRDTRSESSVASWVRNESVSVHEQEVVDEDEDPEAAFYRDLKRQEDERQRRLALRRNQST